MHRNPACEHTDKEKLWADTMQKVNCHWITDETSQWGNTTWGLTRRSGIQLWSRWRQFGSGFSGLRHFVVWQNIGLLRHTVKNSRGTVLLKVRNIHLWAPNDQTVVILFRISLSKCSKNPSPCVKPEFASLFLKKTRKIVSGEVDSSEHWLFCEIKRPRFDPVTETIQKCSYMNSPKHFCISSWQWEVTETDSRNTTMWHQWPALLFIKAAHLCCFMLQV